MSSKNKKLILTIYIPCSICENACSKVSFFVRKLSKKEPENFNVELIGFTQDLFLALTDDDFYNVKNLFERGDFEKIHKFDLELAPYYCPECKMNYCKEHWDREITYEGQFYDAEIGFCPRRHRKMLFD